MKAAFSQLLRLLGILALAGSATAHGATPKPPQEILSRISLKLTGKLPTQQEMEQFAAQMQAHPEESEEIVANAIDAYMQRPGFFDQLDRFNAVWFRTPAGETSKSVAHVVYEDRPFFEILSRNYLYANAALKSKYVATGAAFSGSFPTDFVSWGEVRLRSDEPRFRSVLSNLDLLNRYPDTPTNKNRSRANFIFRTFFCETLSPPPQPDFVSFDDGDDQHGTNPDCIGCHYRLDPMARFFDHWRPAISDTAWYDSSFEAAGAVVVPQQGQEPLRFEGVSETGLAEILKDRPKVQQCVSSKAWEFVFGGNTLIPEVFKQPLQSTFMQRTSFRDAVKASMLHPYFWTTETPPPIAYPDVAPILSMCAGCHAEREFATVFNPDSYPFSADHDANVELVRKIYGAINHRSGFLPMPKTPRPKLPEENISLIREWILNGGIDASGNSTLTMDESERILDE